MLVEKVGFCQWTGMASQSAGSAAAAAVYYFKSVFKVGNGEWRM